MRLTQMCLDVVVSLYSFKCNSLVNGGIGLKAFCATGEVFDVVVVIDGLKLHIC